MKRSWWRNLGVAAAALAAVLVLVGGVAWLSRLVVTDGPADQPPTTTERTTATTTVPTVVVEGLPTVLPPTITWEDVVFEVGEGPQYGNVRRGTDQLLVFQSGREGGANGDSRSILWTSSNGRQWEEHPVEIPDASSLVVVGEAHGTYVMTGFEGNEPRMYLSRDLVEWTVWDVPTPVYRIASTDDAVVGIFNESVIRTTSDFKDTQIIEPFGAGDFGGPMGLVATADRFYAGVWSNSNSSASVWSSADGIAWVVEIDDAERDSVVVPMVAVFGERVLAYMPKGLGSGSPWWIATSGEPFEQVAGPDHGGEITIAGTDDGFLVQFYQSLGQGKEFIAYTTVDGTTWESVPSAAWQNADWLGTSARSTIFAAPREVYLDGLSSWGGRWVIGTTKPRSVSTQDLNASTVPGVWYPVAGALEGAGSEGFDDTLFDVADTPYGIVGTSGRGLWISQDGIKWEQYARDTIEFGAGGGSFARIASSALGVLVVDPVGGAEGWYSNDGVTWQAFDLPSPWGSVRIAANGTVFVLESGGQIWTSTNGIDWVEVNVDPAAAECGFYTLEATPFGFIAGGSNGAGDQPRPVVCTSVDGIEWTKPAELEKTRPAGDSIIDVAGSDLGIVAAGISGAAWYSPDGATWSQVLPPQTRTRGGEGAVGASDLGFIIAFDDWLDDTDALLLESRDGISWSPVTYLKDNDPLAGRYPPIAGDLSMIMREVVPLGDGFLIATESTPSPVHIYEP